MQVARLIPRSQLPITARGGTCIIGVDNFSSYCSINHVLDKISPTICWSTMFGNLRWRQYSGAAGAVGGGS